MILRFSILILLDIIFAITFMNQQLVLAVLFTLAFVYYTIELAAEMEFENVEFELVHLWLPKRLNKFRCVLHIIHITI